MPQGQIPQVRGLFESRDARQSGGVPEDHFNRDGGRRVPDWISGSVLRGLRCKNVRFLLISSFQGVDGHMRYDS